jgi:hypothetical protein
MWVHRGDADTERGSNESVLDPCSAESRYFFFLVPGGEFELSNSCFLVPSSFLLVCKSINCFSPSRQDVVEPLVTLRSNPFHIGITDFLIPQKVSQTQFHQLFGMSPFLPCSFPVLPHPGEILRGSMLYPWKEPIILSPRQPVKYDPRPSRGDRSSAVRTKELPSTSS